YWEWFENENRLAETWPQFMPLLDEDTLEANVPYREWLNKARAQRSEVSWLLERFSKLNISETQGSELYNYQELYLRWRYGDRDSRTGLRRPTEKIFFHDKPLIQRRELNFKEQLDGPSPRLQRLSSVGGRKEIDLARMASTVRYRELTGFTS